MATIAENTQAKAPKTMGERLDRTVRQGKVVGKQSLNKAALIVAGAIGAAGLGRAALVHRNRKNAEQSES